MKPLVLFTLLAAFCSHPLSAAPKISDLLNSPPDFYTSDQGREFLTNLLTFQSSHGDFPKNTDLITAPFTGDPKKLKGTFDNGATIPELRFLARAFAVTQDSRLAAACLKGIDHVLAAQYPNGGWPQTAPPGPGYDRHVTFNDNTMLNLMEFVRDLSTNKFWEFAGPDRRTKAAQAFTRGVDCILKCQIKINGVLTAWCAQHDEITFEPRPARTYELASLSGAESAGLTLLLMSLDKPSPEIIAAVEGAVAWFHSAKLKGLREIKVPDPKGPRGTDKRILQDPAAPPLWARFYDLKTQKPIYVDRDGVPRRRLEDIGYERRNGYAWHVTSPQKVLASSPAWKKRISSP